jgi:secondary thiamine-phosphate synthase enzyme
MIETLTLETTRESEFVDITSDIKSIIAKRRVAEGLCIVYVPHTTAGVTINESADPTVKRDILKSLERLVPLHGDYQHSEGNSAAHIKSSLIGSSVNVLVSDLKPLLGTWQGIFFCEFDGPRSRRVLVQVIAAE